MSKPRIIIADTDVNYIVPLQSKLIKEFFERVDLEIISDEEYFEELFLSPQKVDVLIVADVLYSSLLHKHNISNIFVMVEQYEEEDTEDLSVFKLFKYTSINEIFNEIVGKSVLSLINNVHETKETQIVLVTSASGGVGKTTVAMGISACLTKNYKRVLYINADRLQRFHYMFEEASVIMESDVYKKLANPSDNIYSEIKHIINKEVFQYVPPFKAALMSLGLDYSIYHKLIVSAKKSGDYDFIIVDGDVTFDEEKAVLMESADKIIVVTDQSLSSIISTNLLAVNVNGINSEKYIFVCNNFIKSDDNNLISDDISLKFNVSNYIEHLDCCEKLKVEDLTKEISIQKVAYLLI